MTDPLRRAVVTGGAGGIGQAIVYALARSGHSVVAVGRDATRLRRLTTAATGAGLDVSGRVCDVTDEVQVHKLTQELGPVTVLVNNAGLAETAPLASTSLASWQNHLNTNATSAFLLTRGLLPGMLERDHGRLVFLASTAAHTGARYTSAYTAAKHAMLGLARAVGAEVAGTGVTSNAVCPTFVRSPMTERSVQRIVQRTGRDAEQAETALARASPLGRLVEPEEVAAAVNYLADPQAAAVNGQSLTLDGGGIQR